MLRQRYQLQDWFAAFKHGSHCHQQRYHETSGLQASHDVHASHLDVLEDRLINNELKGASELVCTGALV